MSEPEICQLDKLSFNDVLSKNSVELVFQLTCKQNSKPFQTGMQNVPDADIRLLLTSRAPPQSASQARLIVAYLRYANPICDHCRNKQAPRELFLCTGCCLTWYCNKECQIAHREIHQQRCGQKNGPLDEGPQKLTLLLVQKKPEAPSL